MEISLESFGRLLQNIEASMHGHELFISMFLLGSLQLLDDVPHACQDFMVSNITTSRHILSRAVGEIDTLISLSDTHSI